MVFNIKKIIEKEILTFINENKESKNRSKARNYLRGVGYQDSEVNRIEKGLINDLSPFIRDNEYKFMLGAARFYHEKELTTPEDIKKVKEIIKLITVGHLNEYDNDFNGEDFQTLYNRFETAIEQNFEKDQETLAKTNFEKNQHYDIIKIDSYYDAAKYGKYTEWCVTKNKDSFDQYSSGGLGSFYFVLKKGFENVPKEQGDDSPKDDYGLSMIAVSVDEHGKLNTSTTRWNHSCGGSDNMFTTEELSNIIGQNFYQVFKPKYTKEEIFQKILTDGEKITIKDIEFILYNYKYYLLDNNKNILLNRYFDAIADKITDGWLLVNIVNKGSNFINNKRELLSPDLWFKTAEYFSDGFAPIEIKNKGWNFINTEGKILNPNLWFDGVNRFINNDFASVNIYDKGHNLINKKGELLSPDLWFSSSINKFHDGFAPVTHDKGWNFINTEGKILSPDLWFSGVNNFYDGFAPVKIFEKGWNFINKEGKLLSDKLFTAVDNFNNNMAVVYLKRKRNFINTRGELLSDKWFDRASGFNKYGIANIYIETDDEKGGDNFINTKGEFLYKTWFDYIENFDKGYARVQLNYKENLANERGELLSKIWFDRIEKSFIGNDNLLPFRFIKRPNNKSYYMDTDGVLYINEEGTRFTKLKPQEIEQLKESINIRKIINEEIQKLFI